jgi:hypothetical protein
MVGRMWWKNGSMGSHHGKLRWKHGVAPWEVIDNKYIMRKLMHFSTLKRDLCPPKKAFKEK